MIDMSGHVSVLTYENPYNFHHKQDFQPFLNCPHICATRSLEIGVKQQMNLPYVQSTGAIVDFFYPGWNLPENRFIQYTQLSDLLRDWDDSRELKIIRSFKRNKLNLLITMRNLTEIGLTPYDVRPYATKVEEELFCELWEVMELHFQDYMMEALENVSDIEQVRMVFADAGLPLTNNTVVLHGFYYISPVQHFLFQKWKELGINLVFLNLYHEDYPSLFSFLDENFSEKYGWAKKEDWKKMKDAEVYNGSLFASKFEGIDPLLEMPQTIVEKPYEYMVEFVEDLKDEVGYVSPNSDELKKRIREFRPDAFLGERHFLAYPIGQYLFHLHSVWSEESNDYILNEKILMESFASGWLEMEGENARSYTAQLKALLPYFVNCRSAAEWLERLEQLIIAKRSSLHVFKKYELKRNDYLEAVRVSPVLRFSYFSVRLKELKEIQQFIIKLVKDAEWLVNIEEERITIKTHFQRIQRLLDDSNLKSSLTDEVERALVDVLEEMLKKPIHDDHYYHVGDLSDAIIVFLKNGLEDPDQNELGSLDSSSAERVGVTANKFHFYKMADLDGLILRNDIEQLHLCGMDEQHFPETSSPMPWPLSFELIDNLNNQSANMYTFRKEHSLEFSRYLFFCGLSFRKKVYLSWVRNFNEYENLDKSIYIQTLDLVDMEKEIEAEYQYIEPHYIPETIDTAIVQAGLSQLPQEEFAEMSMCKKRFSYSSLVDGYSTYHSPFHQGFLIGNLVKIYASIGKPKSEIIELLGDMFPNLSEISLRTIVDQNINENYVASMRKYGLQKRRKFNEIDYPESMLSFQFLTHRGAFQNELWLTAFSPTGGIRKQRAELIGEMAQQHGVLADGNPTEFCKLCPHSDYCEDAYYAVDISKKGFDDHDTDTA